jgi:hypothetical protein
MHAGNCCDGVAVGGIRIYILCTRKKHWQAYRMFDLRAGLIDCVSGLADSADAADLAADHASNAADTIGQVKFGE